MTIALALAMIAVVLAGVIVTFGASYGIARFFVTGWAAFFMAVVMIGFGGVVWFCTFLSAYALTQARLGESQARTAFGSVALDALAAAALAMAFGGWLFVRWQKIESARRAATAFE